MKVESIEEQKLKIISDVILACNITEQIDRRNYEEFLNTVSNKWAQKNSKIEALLENKELLI